MAGRFAKMFNIHNKNDAADARAIWLAARQPGKSAAIKSEMRQAALSLHWKRG
jgi:myo-inositol-hexaphosphate 3-phosphohydrolase